MTESPRYRRRHFYSQGAAGFPGDIHLKIMTVQIVLEKGAGTASSLTHGKIFSFQFLNGDLLSLGKRVIPAADQHQKNPR